MGKPKETTVTNNTYGYGPKAPENKDADAVRQLLDADDGGEAAVREGFGRNINQINEAAQSPAFYGGNTSPELMGMQRESRLFRNNNDLGRGLMGAFQNKMAAKTAGYMGLADFTKQPLVQLSGNSTSTGPSFGQTLGSSFAGSFGSGLGQGAS